MTTPWTMRNVATNVAKSSLSVKMTKARMAFRQLFLVLPLLAHLAHFLPVPPPLALYQHYYHFLLETTTTMPCP